MRAGLMVLGVTVFFVPLLGCNRLPLEVRAAEEAERVSAVEEPKQAWGTIKGKVVTLGTILGGGLVRQSNKP